VIGRACSQITTFCHEAVELILRNLVAKVTIVLDLRSYSGVGISQNPILLTFVEEKGDKIFERYHWLMPEKKNHVEAITAINLMVWRRKSAQLLRRGMPVGRRLFRV
jgi:hypothetical protein